jgi:hypothetical protein
MKFYVIILSVCHGGAVMRYKNYAASSDLFLNLNKIYILPILSSELLPTYFEDTFGQSMILEAHKSSIYQF